MMRGSNIMLISPPQKLLHAGIKVKKAQAGEGGGLGVLWVAAAVIGLVAVYVSYRHQQALVTATQQQALAQAVPVNPRSVLYDWERTFRT